MFISSSAPCPGVGIDLGMALCMTSMTCLLHAVQYAAARSDYYQYTCAACLR
jgi:hypothetical protein